MQLPAARADRHDGARHLRAAAQGAYDLGLADLGPRRRGPARGDDHPDAIDVARPLTHVRPDHTMAVQIR
ncbi:hypothetical protein NOCARDAX2BIS_520108 [Nocardioides sp. AX2bis]|nr:hypothetical protein NOCARDAX2BIS_520108 [Nocardioides sp. AX2bis]